tara:strand:- start:178 stop:306 length:129 start_codon:yes stop_codon:yes gene_type:complete
MMRVFAAINLKCCFYEKANNKREEKKRKEREKKRKERGKKRK